MKIARFFLLIIFISAMLALPLYYQIWAKPYRLSKSNIEMPFRQDWEINLSSEEQAEIYSILSQPFSYLGKGFQSYAFLSEDGQYVLKLFRLESAKLMYGRHLSDFVKKALGVKTRRIRSYSCAEEVFNSSKISFDRFREETGLILTHLNPNQKWPMIEIRDHLGLKHRLDGSITRFVLQKRAEKLFPALYASLSGDRDSFYQKVRSFSTLLHSFKKKGVSPDDSKMPSNFGFLGDRAIQIDFASNSLNLENAHIQSDKFRRKMRAWLEVKAPDALQYLDD